MAASVDEDFGFECATPITNYIVLFVKKKKYKYIKIYIYISAKGPVA